MPRKNSRPVSILADHSARVQFRKVVSTIVQPNCSSDGNLEMALMINVAPTNTHNTEIRIRLNKLIVTLQSCKCKGVQQDHEMLNRLNQKNQPVFSMIPHCCLSTDL